MSDGVERVREPQLQVDRSDAAVAWLNSLFRHRWAATPRGTQYKRIPARAPSLAAIMLACFGTI